MNESVSSPEAGHVGTKQRGYEARLLKCSRLGLPLRWPWRLTLCFSWLGSAHFLGCFWKTKRRKHWTGTDRMWRRSKESHVPSWWREQRAVTSLVAWPGVALGSCCAWSLHSFSARADSKLKCAALRRGELALMGKMPVEAREAAPPSCSWEWSHSENLESHAPRMQRLIGGSLVYTWQFIRGHLKSLVCRKSPVLGDGS